MKRYISIFLYIFLYMSLFCENSGYLNFYSSFSGSWYCEDNIKYLSSKERKTFNDNFGFDEFKLQNYKCIGYETIFIAPPVKELGFGLFWIYGSGPRAIIDVKMDNKQRFTLELAILEKNENNEYTMSSPFSDFLEMINTDDVLIYHGKKLYKLSSQPKGTEKKAVINDLCVQLHLYPNINSEIWGQLKKNMQVILKEHTETKFEIDGESWYWYKVDYPTLPDGWVYGKYLDIEE